MSLEVARHEADRLAVANSKRELQAKVAARIAAADGKRREGRFAELDRQIAKEYPELGGFR